jgi:aminoglycoside/choline kinase family phosphotransferase
VIKSSPPNLPNSIAGTVEEITPIAGDASTRSFYRIQRRKEAGGGSVILMDYGKPFHGDTDDMVLTWLLLEAGLPVPEIVSSHPESGMLVLADAGISCLEEALSGDAATDEALYTQAVTIAAKIAREGTPVLAASSRETSPCLNQKRFRFEMNFFLQHYHCGMLGNLPDGEPYRRLRSELLDIADQAAAVRPLVLCHRDYHSRNLVLSPAGDLYMVDIQDAQLGPLGYDLASLLWDPYSPVDLPFRTKMIELFCQNMQLSTRNFTEKLEILALQRMFKALGTFGYQISSLHHDRYRAAIPVTLKQIAQLEIGDLPGFR